MSAEEVAAFEQEENLKDINKIRYYDEAGKRADLATKPFSHYAPMVQRIEERHPPDQSKKID